MRHLAEKYHFGQFRKGEEKLPYIVHPQAVAETLLTWGANENSKLIQIAWGHDLLEDTTVSESEILAVSDAEVLKHAQASPEKYKDLIVRLWGVSAHFVDLPRELQDEMIARFGG